MTGYSCIVRSVGQRDDDAGARALRFSDLEDYTNDAGVRDRLLPGFDALICF